MKVFILVFLFVPGLLLSQDIDRTLYQEINIIEAFAMSRNSTSGTGQYYRSTVHFLRREGFTNINARVFVTISQREFSFNYDIMIPSDYSHGAYFQRGTLHDINRFQVVTIYYRLTAHGNELDHVEKINGKYFIVEASYRTLENLRLRTSGNLSAGVILTIQRGETVIVLEEGAMDYIDGISSKWVKVRLNNGTEGWCFGGYLGF